MIAPSEFRRRIQSRLDQQQRLVQSLLQLREQLQGSVFARYGVCGKENCACRQGHKHGPYWVLSTRTAGKGSFTYLEVDQAPRARELVKQHKQFQSGMRKLRKLNLELVDLLKRYQSAAARRSGRELGLAATR